MILQTRLWRVINPDLTKKAQAMRRRDKVKSFNQHKLIFTRQSVATDHCRSTLLPTLLHRDTSKLHTVNWNIAKLSLSYPEAYYRDCSFSKGDTELYKIKIIAFLLNSFD